MCELFEVSRSGFYKWRKRVSQPQQRGELDQFIIECQAQVNQSYGYRRVCLWIKQNKSVEYHPLTVLHHMRKLDLLAQIRRRRPYTLYKQGGHRYENLLNRQFIQKQMNYRWVTDITYIITPQRTYYLYAIMDLCGRYIVAYRLGTEINATLVSDTVRDAFAREKGKVADGLLLHSDQGCQYTSEEYFALTQEYHFSASMSRRGCPYDNAIMENFFGTFKPVFSDIIGVVILLDLIALFLLILLCADAAVGSNLLFFGGFFFADFPDNQCLHLPLRSSAGER